MIPMLKILSNTAFAVFVSLTMLTSSVHADPSEGKGKKDKVKVEKHKNNAHKQTEAGSITFIDVRFEDIRRIAVDNHYTGYKSLPPGFRKNLARGKPLPPGIAKKVVPGPILQHLPRYSGYEWRVCGSDLVLVSIATEIIEQVLGGVFQ